MGRPRSGCFLLWEERRKVPACIAVGTLGDCRGGALGQYVTTRWAAGGSQINDPVRGSDDIKVMFDHHHGVARIN